MSDTQLSEDIIVRLVSPEHEVNALAVASSMFALVSLLEEIRRNDVDGIPMAVKAKPFKQGSFEIDLEIIAYAGVLLLTDAPVIDHTITTLKSCLSHLIQSRKSAREAISVSDVKAKRDVNVIQNLSITQNFYLPSPNVQEKLTSASNELLADSAINALEIYRGKKETKREKIIEIPREEFPLLASHQEGDSSLPSRDRKSRATLTIAAPDLVGQGKWRFLRKGSMLWAGFKDKKFLSDVANGAESFQAGDQLVVELITHEVLNEVTLDYEIKGHTIARVVSHEKAKRQRRLPDA